MVGGREEERQALMVALLMGTAVYLRIWARQSNDPSFTAHDREELRRQFERANLEAMDESAECRMKYDTEFGKRKNRQLQDELLKVKASLSASTRAFDLLQKYVLKFHYVPVPQEVVVRDVRTISSDVGQASLQLVLPHPIMYIIIADAIPPCMTTDPPQHPHPRYIHFLYMLFFYHCGIMRC